MIVKCQSYVRRYLVQKNGIKGPGFYNRNICKNTEDFYFMTDINDILDIYFFSYMDDENNVWYFDTYFILFVAVDIVTSIYK